MWQANSAKGIIISSRDGSKTQGSQWSLGPPHGPVDAWISAWVDEALCQTEHGVRGSRVMRQQQRTANFPSRHLLAAVWELNQMTPVKCCSALSIVLGFFLTCIASRRKLVALALSLTPLALLAEWICFCLRCSAVEQVCFLGFGLLCRA